MHKWDGRPRRLLTKPPPRPVDTCASGASPAEPINRSVRAPSPRFFRLPATCTTSSCFNSHRLIVTTPPLMRPPSSAERRHFYFGQRGHYDFCPTLTCALTAARSDTKLCSAWSHWIPILRMMGLDRKAGMESNVAVRPARTGIYYANSFFKRSTPVDLLCFKPLATIDRPTPSRPACFAGSAGKTLARTGAAERSGSAPVAAGTRSTASFGSRSSAAFRLARTDLGRLVLEQAQASWRPR